MVISFDIPNAKAARLGDAMPLVGYTYNPNFIDPGDPSGSAYTDTQQKVIFLKNVTISYWKEIVDNYERQITLASASAALTRLDASDIT